MRQRRQLQPPNNRSLTHSLTHALTHSFPLPYNNSHLTHTLSLTHSLSLHTYIQTYIHTTVNPPQHTKHNAATTRCVGRFVSVVKVGAGGPGMLLPWLGVIMRDVLEVGSVTLLMCSCGT